jgi:hypothetical protein
MPPCDGFHFQDDYILIFKNFNRTIKFWGSTDFEGTVLTSCVHQREFYHRTSRVVEYYEKREPYSVLNNEYLSYWVDFKHNIVYRFEEYDLPSPEAYVPKNINLQDFKALKPSIKWHKRAEFFPVGAAYLADTFFDTFIDALEALYKKLILELNSLNTRYEGSCPLETLERDEAIPFIDNVAIAAGFKPKNGEDISMEWRHF